MYTAIFTSINHHDKIISTEQLGGPRKALLTNYFTPITSQQLLHTNYFTPITSHQLLHSDI